MVFIRNFAVVKTKTLSFGLRKKAMKGGQVNYIKHKIVMDFNSLILKKRSIVFGFVVAQLAVYACSSSDEDETTPSVVKLNCGDKIEGTRDVNGQTIHTTVGGTVADYVDLGIVVNGHRVLFATHNLGASDSLQVGAKLAWGELGAKEEGYINGIKYKDGKEYYDFDNLKYCVVDNETNSKSFTKYLTTNGENTRLEACDDAATINWGSKWRMPTDDELNALYSGKNLTYNVTPNGIVITSKAIGCEGNFIFIPFSEKDYSDGIIHSSINLSP